MREVETNRDMEIYAQALYDVITALTKENHCKSYDPLKIEGKIAHSYVFQLCDGGRHHPFESLEQLKTAMFKETIEWISECQYALTSDDMNEEPVEVLGVYFNHEDAVKAAQAEMVNNDWRECGHDRWVCDKLGWRLMIHNFCGNMKCTNY